MFSFQPSAMESCCLEFCKPQIPKQVCLFINQNFHQCERDDSVILWFEANFHIGALKVMRLKIVVALIHHTLGILKIFKIIRKNIPTMICLCPKNYQFSYLACCGEWTGVSVPTLPKPKRINVIWKNMSE